MNTIICKKCFNYSVFQTKLNDVFCHKHSNELCKVNPQQLERIKHSVDQKSKEIIKKFLIKANHTIARVLGRSRNLPEDHCSSEDKFIIEKCISKLKLLLEKCSKTDSIEAKAFYLPLELFLIMPSDGADRFTENVIMPDLNEDITNQAEMWLKFTDYIFNCNYFKILDSDVTWCYYQVSFQSLNDLLWVGLYQATEYLLIYEYESAQECIETCKEIRKEISYPHKIDEYIIEGFLLVIKFDQIDKKTKFNRRLQELENKIISADKMMKLKMFYHIFMHIFLYLNDLQSSKMYAKKLLNHFPSIEAYSLLSNIYMLSLNLQKSRKYLKKAYILVKKYMKKNYLMRSIILEEFGIISIYQNQKEKANKYFKVAIRYLKEEKPKNQLIAFQKQYYLAKILLLQSKFQGSFEIYKEIFQFIKKKSNSLISAEVIKYHQEYILLLYWINLVSEARSEIFKNIKIWIDKFLPCNHPVLFWMYLLSSAIAFRSGLWDECGSYLRRAKEIIMSNHFNNIKLLRAIVDEYFGFLCVKINDLDEAEKHLKDCLQLYEAPECHPVVDLFWVTHSLSGIYLKKQNFKKSFEYLRKARYSKQFHDINTVEKKLERKEDQLADTEFIIQSSSENIENKYNFLHKLGNLSDHFIKYYELRHIKEKSTWKREKIKGSLYDEIIERSKIGLYWTEKELIEMASSLSESLAILHENYIYHGNLNLSSIFLSINGQWKIGNFLEARHFWINDINTNKLLELEKNDCADSGIESFGDDSSCHKITIPSDRKEIQSLGKIIWMAASLNVLNPDTSISDTTIKEKYSLKFQKFIDLMILIREDNLYWPYMRDINLKARQLLKTSTQEHYLIDLELQRLNLILNEHKFH